MSEGAGFSAMQASSGLASSVLPRSGGLGDAVAQQLSARIIDGSLPPLTRLPTEKQLVAQFGVSRAVVREAIARLKTEGLVETRQGAGAFVAARPGLTSFRLAPGGQLPPDELKFAFELRSAVERQAAALAARRRSASDIAALRAAFARMQKAEREDPAAGALADDAFHAAVAMASGNPLLRRFGDFLAQQFSATRRLTWSAEAVRQGKTAAAQAGHAALLEAIIAGDEAAAARAAQDHVEQAALHFGADLKE